MSKFHVPTHLTLSWKSKICRPRYKFQKKVLILNNASDWSTTTTHQLQPHQTAHRPLTLLTVAELCTSILHKIQNVICNDSQRLGPVLRLREPGDGGGAGRLARAGDPPQP